MRLIYDTRPVVLSTQRKIKHATAHYRRREQEPVYCSEIQYFTYALE